MYIYHCTVSVIVQYISISRFEIEVCALWLMLMVFPLHAVIEPCLDTELNEFPLRMRDWLKNVLVTLYERDEENNLLTEKQKLRVSRSN